MSGKPKLSHARFGVLALLTVGTAINYLDRSVLSVAAPYMSKDLGLSAAVMGIVFSAFSWTYAASQIPGGIVLDKFGARMTYFFSVTIWSAFTLAHGFATNLVTLLAFRLGLGVAEAPAYPCNSRVLSSWFPQSERARATGVYAVGQYAGLAFLSPVLFWIASTFGWRVLLILVGIIGIAFGLIWLMLYREPADSKSVNQAELDHIAAGGGLGEIKASQPFHWKQVGFLLKQRQVVGAALGQFAGNSTLVFFLTWFPTYLATERHLEWVKVGVWAILPFVFASVGVVAGGIISDALFKWTKSATIARKLPIVSGLIMASCIVAANFVNDNTLVIAVMSVAFFGQGMVNLGWTLLTDIAPKPLIGLTAGLFNFGANMAGIVTPMVIGFIVAGTGSFVLALGFITAMALIGVFSYLFILGPVVRVEMPQDGSL